MPIVFALAAAFSNALNVVTQHIASISDPGHTKGWRFVRYLVSNPLWLFGWVALAAGFVFQALALHNGQLSVVQPLLVTELVFALVLRRLWIRQQIRDVTWWAAASPACPWRSSWPCPSPPGATPRRRAPPGSVPPWPRRGGRQSWPWSGGAARRCAGRRRSGAATPILWALVATFIKAMTDTLTQFGVWGMFTHWPVYALIVVGIVAELLEPGRAARRAAEHVAAVHRHRRPDREHRLSVWVFAEMFTESVSGSPSGPSSFAAMCVSARCWPGPRRPPWTRAGTGAGPTTNVRLSLTPASSSGEVPALALLVVVQHVLGDEDAVHLVGTVGQAQRAGAEVHLGQREVARDARPPPRPGWPGRRPGCRRPARRP